MIDARIDALEMDDPIIHNAMTMLRMGKTTEREALIVMVVALHTACKLTRKAYLDHLNICPPTMIVQRC